MLMFASADCLCSRLSGLQSGYAPAPIELASNKRTTVRRRYSEMCYLHGGL